MRVTANGSPLELPEDSTVEDAVRELGLGRNWVVVERNGEAVPRSEAGRVRLGEGDVLEIVRPVQGG
ncbi:MAG TPA: sulfur carrier protein ThiS [Actinomycetota bacterium]|nr:sulfur carrier protein ThiS [Actinomycetota bacterium]